MRAAILYFCMLVLTVSWSSVRNSLLGRDENVESGSNEDLNGSWTLQIENLEHQVITTMSIRFVDAPATSFLSGNWKRIMVESYSPSNDRFFPTSEPLSYELHKNHLVIGRNEICDNYLHLIGELRNSATHGRYVCFGLGGGTRLGYFSLSQAR